MNTTRKPEANHSLSKRADKVVRTARNTFVALLLALCVIQSGCVAPIGADRVAPAKAYRQIHDNPVSHDRPSRDTRWALYRYQQDAQFEAAPDDALRAMQAKAIETRERSLLYVLSELNYLVGERVRASLKPWETRDAREYYFAAAVYAWLYLFGDATDAPPSPFDARFRTACDLYNYGLGWALTEPRSTNAAAVLAGGTRRLAGADVTVEFKHRDFPWELSRFDQFVVADQYVVRGLSVRNRQPGVGTPLVGVIKADSKVKFSRAVPATVLLRPEGGLADLAQGRLRASLELYSAFDTASVRVGDQDVPLETDLTIATAYALNQSFIWKLGMAQFFSAEEKIPSAVYQTQPYRPGRVPVVFVHGTFSSPVWWAEMVNTLAADPELRRRCQFWYFIYNSGNPTPYSAVKLREALQATVRELDPEGRDPALQQMVVIGHSQGGLLTKLTATDTGDKIFDMVVKTNRAGELKISAEEEAALRRFTCFKALPFVKEVIFISTPHRGSYLAGGFVRNLVRKFVTPPAIMMKRAAEITGFQEKVDIPKEFRGMRTSLDSMSPENPYMLALADIPLAPGVEGHSIVAVEGDGDYHHGKDGLVSYGSAHVDYVKSECIVRSYHSCQDQPATIEEVRRILTEHVRTLPASATK